MVGGGTVARPSEARVSTGIASLDAMLEGGLVARRPYLIVGPSGTGKTTLAIEFLCEGVRRNERVLLVTLEEPPNEARVNHRGLEPELSRVEVFDAIPDIMRYERTPFKDIASVRSAIPFSEVPLRIRRSPELASVEVTITALEQMLRTEVVRRGYTRLVVDSLTALQYFCMKGFDPVAGAQSFLRFLSDLRVTTLLTVESPLEDIETPERMLARGEIRLFRWELDGQTVRAIGVEKFRGSSHDVRLHPYRIGPQGIDINLPVTISRDTRMIIEPIVPHLHPPAAAAPVLPVVSPVTPLVDEVRDLILLGADVAPARSEIEAALTATNEGHPDEAQAHLSRVSSLVMGLVEQLSHGAHPDAPDEHGAFAAYQRVRARVDAVRTGVPPTNLPPPSVLQVQLGALLSLLPTPIAPAEPSPPPASAVPEPVPAEPAGNPPTPPSEVVEPLALVTEAPAIPPEPAPEIVAAPPEPAPTATPEPAPSAAPIPSELSAPSAPETPPEPQREAPSTTTVVPNAEPHGARVGRAGAVRSFPSPPKPRAPPPPEKSAKPAPAPTPRTAQRKEEPPPLPTTAVPGWAPPSVPVPKEPARLAGPPLPPEGPPPTATEVAPPAPPSAPKKRRKAAAPAGKKPTAHARSGAAHPGHTVPPAVAPPPHPVTDVPVVVPTVEPSAPPPSAETPAKLRRRPPKKRKAPPVVSATVEPIPPGVFGAANEAPSSEKPPADAPPPGG